MASLIGNLIEILDSEDKEYRQLLELSTSKTQIIVKGDLDALTQLTEKEQGHVDRISALEVRRQSAMTEIAKILNTDVDALKLSELISLLQKTPKEQKQLAEIHDRLHKTLYEMKIVNERNEDLLNTAIEMVNFNMTLIQSMRTAPETANYNRGAYSAGTVLGTATGSFDAKQ
ncbi:MAG: flagellar protein FlgN [Lachnospiraceae bacterium]|nr:flagellar protein FlgN [Lachnospiraceae bacterium]